MERLSIPATKSNQIRIKEELDIAQDGKELLDQKKDILISHINLLTDKADRARKHLDEILLDAYSKLEMAIIEAGRSNVEAAGIAVDAGIEIEVRERSLMGVVLPLVSIKVPDFKPEYGLGTTTASMDQVRQTILSALDVLGELAEVEIGLQRLMHETKKTLKRINALSYIYIPLYKATLKFIEQSLEEKDREGLFQLKRIKARTKPKKRSEL